MNRTAANIRVLKENVINERLQKSVRYFHWKPSWIGIKALNTKTVFSTSFFLFLFLLLSLFLGGELQPTESNSYRDTAECPCIAAIRTMCWMDSLIINVPFRLAFGLQNRLTLWGNLQNRQREGANTEEEEK